ncbi:hypothetical protein PoB_003482600 [Plakobranchus ocellatus]|uniref:Uncharacterized protein n=1 Tax=Plakobranchus ocellatus TaxID=259542 RepID=A0AAV4AAX9_9GAST|nr:hypothetical protein PoB_003482600 [Plakobranchus ocellatus]
MLTQTGGDEALAPITELVKQVVLASPRFLHNRRQIRHEQPEMKVSARNTALRRTNKPRASKFDIVVTDSAHFTRAKLLPLWIT